MSSRASAVLLAIWASSLWATRAGATPPAAGSNHVLRAGILGLLQSQITPPEPALPSEEGHPFAEMYAPYLEMSDEELGKLLDESPDVLPAASLGRTNAGKVFNSVKLPPGEGYSINHPNRTNGTPETIAYIQAAIAKVREQFPDTPDLFVGDISRIKGGRFGRHLSHHCGRDVDLAYYYMDYNKWYRRAGQSSLDRPRTWALVRALLTEGHVYMMFINRSVQRLLYNYAQYIGEDPAWLDQVFQFPGYGQKGLIRHAEGHDTHIHVRFQNPLSQELGRRLYPLLLDRGQVRPLYGYERYTIRKGDTLASLAQKFHTSIAVLQRVNSMRSTRLWSGRRFRIPRPSGVAVVTAPITVMPKHRPSPPLHPEKVATYSAELMAKLEREAQAKAQKERRGKARAQAKGRKAKGAKAQARAKAKAPSKGRAKTATARKVRSGDSLWTIARHFGVSADDIKKWNRLKSTRLQPGMILTIRK